MHWLVYVVNYFVLINIITLVAMRVDLSRQRKGKSRLPEEALFLLALVGGGVGAKIGEDALEYKTEKHPMGDMLRVVMILQVIIFFVVVAFLLR